MLREIDDDSLARSGRENVRIGYDQRFAGTGYPRIHAGIDANHLFGSQAEPAGKIVQRVLVDGYHRLIPANHRVVILGEGIHGGVHDSGASERE